VTVVLFRLGVDLASTAFAHLIVIVLFSLMGSFIAPALRAGMSAAGLVYFFAPAIFDFRIGNPQHIGVMVGFFAYLGDCDAVDPKYPEATVSCLITLSGTSKKND
jgi:hypothetical protein